MSYAYTKNDRLLVDKLDVKRASRALPKLLQEYLLNYPDLNELHYNDCQDFIARLAGFSNSYELIRSAKSNDKACDGRIPLLIIQEEALQAGVPFPKVLPSNFGPEWREQAFELFTKAIDCQEPGKMELIVLVGKSGSGKTLLSKHMVHHLGGVVLDASLMIDGIHEGHASKGAVLVYDRPAVIPQAPKNISGTPEGWMNQLKDINQFRQLVRSNFDVNDYLGLYWRLERSVESFAESHIVTCMPNESELEKLMSLAVWRAAHVVNLDTMSFYTIRPSARVV